MDSLPISQESVLSARPLIEATGIFISNVTQDLRECQAKSYILLISIGPKHRNLNQKE